MGFSLKGNVAAVTGVTLVRGRDQVIHVVFCSDRRLPRVKHIMLGSVLNMERPDHGEYGVVNVRHASEHGLLDPCHVSD